MKKNLYFSIFAGTLLICSCQNELYKDATSEYRSAQGAYIKTGESSQVFVEEGKEVDVKSITVSLVQQENDTKTVTVEAGNKEQLEAYNKKHGTDYLMLQLQADTAISAGKVQGCEILLAGKLRLAGKTEGRYGTRD